MKLRVLIMKECEALVAQCLDYDITAQALTRSELEYRFAWALVADILIHRMNNQSIANIPPAPQSYHERYEHAVPIGTWELGTWKFGSGTPDVEAAVKADIASIEPIKVRVEP